MIDPVLQPDLLYLQVHGLKARPEELNAALAHAIDTMQATLYGETISELTPAEAAVLRAGGAVLEEQLGPDPLAQTAAKFAAILSTSLTTAEAAARLEVHVTRVRQMLTDRTLYGVSVDGRWYIPEFQFLSGSNRLIPNITVVNAVLDPELHPVAVLNWYITPNPDLFIGDDVERTVSPLKWLQAGNPVEPVVKLASDL